MLKLVYCVMVQDQLLVCLTAGDHNSLRPATVLNGFSQRPLGGIEITPFPEPKFNRERLSV
jgi:hypothetical protein